MRLKRAALYRKKKPCRAQPSEAEAASARERSHAVLFREAAAGGFSMRAGITERPARRALRIVRACRQRAGE